MQFRKRSRCDDSGRKIHKVIINPEPQRTLRRFFKGSSYSLLQWKKKNYPPKKKEHIKIFWFLFFWDFSGNNFLKLSNRKFEMHDLFDWRFIVYKSPGNNVS